MKRLRILIARYRLSAAQRRYDESKAHVETVLSAASCDRARFHAATIALRVEENDLASLDWIDNQHVWQHLPARTVRQLAAAGIHKPS